MAIVARRANKLTAVEASVACFTGLKHWQNDWGQNDKRIVLPSIILPEIVLPWRAVADYSAAWLGALKRA